MEVKVDLNQLFIFAKMVKHQSFNKAAQELAIEKSAMTAINFRGGENDKEALAVTIPTHD